MRVMLVCERQAVEPFLPDMVSEKRPPCGVEPGITVPTVVAVLHDTLQHRGKRQRKQHTPRDELTLLRIQVM